MRVAVGTGQKFRRAFAGLLLLCAGYGVLGAAKDKHLFLIHVAPPVDPETVQVSYFMTGDFGGVGGFRVDTGEQAIGIRLDQTSKPPKTLKAILYASGCEIGLFRVDDLKTSDRDTQFTCKALPTLIVPSTFPRPAALRAYNLEVEVNYTGTWPMRFFGIADGSIPPIRIQTAAVGPDGAFQLKLPDFTKDPLFSSVQKDAWLELHVRERLAGNIVGELKPPESVATPLGMKIEAGYPAPMAFTFVSAR